MPLKIAILASGRGSNVQAILKAIECQQLEVQVQCILSNIEGALVLDIGKAAGIPTFAVPHQGLSREAHEEELLALLGAYEIDYLVLAGYMRLLTPKLLDAYNKDGQYRIINIHPALLPAFPGAHGYEDAFAYGVKLSGVTVHFVDEMMDHGPILLQDSFPRFDNDTLDTFKARGLALEHALYPKALKMLAEGELHFHISPSSQRPYIEVKPRVLC